MLVQLTQDVQCREASLKGKAQYSRPSLIMGALIIAKVNNILSCVFLHEHYYAVGCQAECHNTECRGALL